MTESEATREMTFEEEFEILQSEKDELFAMERTGSETLFANCVVRRALRCIRKLLIEKVQFEAIGTVEELKAIKQWKADIIESFNRYDVNSVDELMKRFKELAEKAEPKKPINIRQNDTLSAIFDCPSCGRTQKIQYQGFHCKECGQNLDWE